MQILSDHEESGGLMERQSLRLGTQRCPSGFVLGTCVTDCALQVGLKTSWMFLEGSRFQPPQSGSENEPE